MIGGVHKTKRFLRYRQEEPTIFDPKSFRTKKVSSHTELIIGCPKGHFEKGKCNVGTKVQSILKKR